MAKPWMEIGRYGSVGLELVLTILIPAAIGYWLDGRYWNRGGWGAGTGFLVGVVVGFRNLIRTANGMQRDIERAEANDPQANRWTVDKSWLHIEGAETPDPRRDPKDGNPDGENGPPN